MQAAAKKNAGAGPGVSVFVELSIVELWLSATVAVEPVDLRERLLEPADRLGAGRHGEHSGSA